MVQPREYPFDRRAGDLVPEDLEALKQVHEGWYVEYKQQSIGRRDIAKSLSAFANQYGGWLFIGIAEDRATHIAGTFPGIPTSSVQNELESIRNATKDLLRPSVFYDHKVIDGPIDSIDLPAGRSVIAIHIPEGPDTPYVHNDGRIYRRIADTSDPVPVTDRAELDVLSQRREIALSRLDNRVRRSPMTSEAEEDHPFAQLHILSDPYEILGHRYRGDLDSFADIMQGNMFPFDNIFHSYEGFVARQVGGNDAYMRLLTWEFSRHCHSLISIPINVYDLSSLRATYVNSATVVDFTRVVNDSGIDPVRILDLNRMLEIFFAVSLRHRRLAWEAGITGPFYVKCHLENIWRTIPFLQSTDFISHINRFGLPLVQNSSVVLPEGRTLDSFVVLDEHMAPVSEDDPLSGNAISAADAGSIARRILPAFGLSLDLALNAISRRVAGTTL